MERRHRSASASASASSGAGLPERVVEEALLVLVGQGTTAPPLPLCLALREGRHVAEAVAGLRVAPHAAEVLLRFAPLAPRVVVAIVVNGDDGVALAAAAG